MVDLKKLPGDEKLRLCRYYYYGGFALLPFLWLVNGVWFFRSAFLAPHFAEQPEIRKYVVRSFVGSCIWTIMFIIWIVIFQVNRVAWGELGDNLAFVQPKGRP